MFFSFSLTWGDASFFIDAISFLIDFKSLLAPPRLDFVASLSDFFKSL
jgi:hypothetical protein